MSKVVDVSILDVHDTIRVTPIDGVIHALTDDDLPVINRKWANFWKSKYLEVLLELRNVNRGVAQRQRRKQRKVDNDWLLSYTAVPIATWVNLFNSVVAKHSVPADDAPQRTYIYAVYAEMLEIVRQCIIKLRDGDGSKGRGEFDMTVTISTIMAMVLSAWSIAVIEAKAFDSRRAVNDRRVMLKGARNLRHYMADQALYLRQFREVWANQEWENPFNIRKLIMEASNEKPIIGFRRVAVIDDYTCSVCVERNNILIWDSVDATKDCQHVMVGGICRCVAEPMYE